MAGGVSSLINPIRMPHVAPVMNRWLLLRFDALGAFSIFIITLFALSGYISGGWAGITITSAMQFTVSVYWTCRLATQLELDLK
jgi:hypothetical protein